MTKQEECLKHDWHYSESHEFRICWKCLRKEARDWRLFEH